MKSAFLQIRYFVFEMAQAMRDCLLNEDIRVNSAAQVSAVRADYSWDAVADRIYRVIAGYRGEQERNA